MTNSEWRKEMRRVIIGTLSCGPYAVRLKVAGVLFRCKPSVEGGVIVYKGNERKQYTHLTLDEWAEWAAEYATGRS